MAAFATAGGISLINLGSKGAGMIYSGPYLGLAPE